MRIELVQGDTSPIYKFQRKNANKEIITTQPQKMWITFKENTYKKEALFQKTLEQGIKYNASDNYYRFQIDPQDTGDLPYGIYSFDIAIINEAGEKKTLLSDGTLEILEHCTKKNNEV